MDEEIFTDIYYDTEEYALLKNDIWLRRRDGKWELKIPLHQNMDAKDRRYQEIEGEENLRQVFAVPALKDFLSDIAEFGYVPICELKTRKKEHEKAAFVSDRKRVLEYLKKKKSKNYQVLVEAGIVNK